jgi:GNAT superfamily N-acetyltransferase
MHALPVVEPLNKSHNVDQFSSGVPELDDWLRDRARDPAFVDEAKTWVATDGSSVIGYYVLLSNQIVRKRASTELLGATTMHPIPTTYLARFAIDQRLQGQGYGTELLLHVFVTAAKAAQLVHSRAIDLHAHDEKARKFYVEKGGFKPLSDTRPLDLYILMSDVETTLKEWGHLI